MTQRKLRFSEVAIGKILIVKKLYEETINHLRTSIYRKQKKPPTEVSGLIYIKKISVMPYRKELILSLNQSFFSIRLQADSPS